MQNPDIITILCRIEPRLVPNLKDRHGSFCHAPVTKGICVLSRLPEHKGGSRISGEGANMYKDVGLALLILSHVS